jgi:hypothetical protein
VLPLAPRGQSVAASPLGALLFPQDPLRRGLSILGPRARALKAGAHRLPALAYERQSIVLLLQSDTAATTRQSALRGARVFPSPLTEQRSG